MVGDNNADILLLKGCHNTLNILHSNWVNARKWLVKQDKRRVNSNCACNLCTTTLTTRELVTETFAYFLQTELLDKLLKTMTLVLLCIVCNLKHRADIILNAQATENRRLLRKVAHAKLRTLIYWQLCQLVYRSVVVLKEDSSAIWLDKTYNHIERGGLTCTIWAEQTNNLALLYINRDMIYDGA